MSESVPRFSLKSSGQFYCSNCGSPCERLYQHYCNACHAEYMRKNRPRHSELTDEQKKKANARAYLKEYVKRGYIKKEPCIICGTMEKLEAHHPDYSKPLEVVWYCREHHLEFHKQNS